MQPVEFIWQDGSLVPWEQATVHVLAHGLHYGTGVFEGIRSYPTDRGPAVFRLDDHLARLEASAAAVGLDLGFPRPRIREAVHAVIGANGLVAAYIRPIAFFGAGRLGIDPAGAPVHLIVAAWTAGAYLGPDGLEHGIRAMFSSWRRIEAGVLVPHAKATGQYLNSVLARREATAAGYEEAILLNGAGHVAEGSGENLFIVRAGAVATPPLSDGILPGITRDSVMKLLADDGFAVEERSLGRDDIFGADEVFLTGTAAEVTPVRAIGEDAIGTGRPGPVTRRAQDLYRNAVTGRSDRYRTWLEFV